MLNWTLSASDTLSDHNLKNMNRAPGHLHRLILSVGQDLIYGSSNGQVNTPKHVGLAMAIKHLTGSKQVISMLNRFGHTVSYDSLQRMETSLAVEQLKKTEEMGIVLPSNIFPGTFIHCAADNIDFKENTLDGKGTTHSSTVVLFQQKIPLGQSPMPENKSKGRRRSVEKLSICENMRTFSATGKRPIVDCYTGNTLPHQSFQD